MSVLLDRPVQVSRPVATGTRLGVRALALLPWLIAGAGLLVALHLTHTRSVDIAVYGCYWALAIVLPGTLVHRALRGSRGNLPEDIGYGAATGLLLELVAWALTAATGQQHLLRYWALPVIVAFAAVPALRRHWRIAEPAPLPRRWAWAMAGTLLLVTGWAATSWATTPLPPVDTEYYQDLMYHLALVQELTRTMPFEVPQLAGDSLRYHYLSDAHMAGASMITGVSPATVLLRLWLVPVGATAVLAMAALAREVTGRWWTGPLAAAVGFAGLPLALGAPVTAYGAGSLSFASPSQTYAMPLLILLVACAVDALRGRPLRAAWALVPLLALACAGAKSSALPPLLAGLLLAGVVVWWRDRRVPVTVLGLIAAVLAAMAIGFRIFAGGGAGTLGVQVLGVLRWMEPYGSTLGGRDGVDAVGLLPPGAETASVTGWIFIVGVICWWTLMQAPRLLGVLALGLRPTRTDPVAWLLAGSTIAATGAMWVFFHPSASQLYFFLCAAPLGALLSVWLLAEHVRGWRVPVAAFVLGTVWPFVSAFLAVEVPRPADDTLLDWVGALALPVLWTGLAFTGVIVLAVILRRLALSRAGAAQPVARSGRVLLGVAPRVTLLVAVTAAVLGAGLGSGISQTYKALDRAAFGPSRPAPAPQRIITAAEMRAALWLDEHAADDDVVATNVHCQPIGRAKPCDARAFWVAGLGGHRTVVESWGYSDATVAANGVNGLKYPLQPAPDPALFALNERIFTAPTAADLDTLRRSHAVRWLFADTRAGAVSPQLATLATIRRTDGPVTIYELD